MGIRGCPSWRFVLADDHQPGDLEIIGSLAPSDARANDNFDVVWEKDIHIAYKNVDYLRGSSNNLISASVIENSNPVQDSTIWIVGDSFSGHIIPFLARCFANTVFYPFTIEEFDNLKNAYAQASNKPSIVIIELVERKF